YNVLDIDARAHRLGAGARELLHAVDGLEAILQHVAHRRDGGARLLRFLRIECTLDALQLESQRMKQHVLEIVYDPESDLAERKKALGTIGRKLHQPGIEHHARRLEKDQ